MDTRSRFITLPAGVRSVTGGVTTPKGFVAAGVAAGVKKSGRRDVGLLLSQHECVSAAFFTRNAAAAAPVILTRGSCDCGHLRGVVANSGNANACTGSRGMADAVRMQAVAAEAVGVPLAQMAVASTGVIGVPLPLSAVEAGIRRAAARLERAGGDHFAAAIRTTDRSEKHGALAVSVAGGEVRLGFAAKGAGMISPNMATTLCFVTSDAPVAPADWEAMCRRAVNVSFNRITVDGQESTNDTIIALANGAAGVKLNDEDLPKLEQALTAGLTAMALEVVADGEGATHTVRLTVDGAHDAEEAERAARAIANSPLVQTAVFGADPNWGRIVQAAGQVLTPSDGGGLICDVVFEDLVVFRDGEGVWLTAEEERELRQILTARELELCVHLSRGDGAAQIYFSDLTHDYVRLNAGMRS